LERGEPINPEILNPEKFKILTEEEYEESHELGRKLMERVVKLMERAIEQYSIHKQALKNLDLCQIDYQKRRYAQQVREYFQKLGKPIPPLLKPYVEDYKT